MLFSVGSSLYWVEITQLGVSQLSTTTDQLNAQNAGTARFWGLQH